MTSCSLVRDADLNFLLVVEFIIYAIIDWACIRC